MKIRKKANKKNNIIFLPKTIKELCYVNYGKQQKHFLKKKNNQAQDFALE